MARYILIDTKYRQMAFPSPSDGALIKPYQWSFRTPVLLLFSSPILSKNYFHNREFVQVLNSWFLFSMRWIRLSNIQQSTVLNRCRPPISSICRNTQSCILIKSCSMTICRKFHQPRRPPLLLLKLQFSMTQLLTQSVAHSTRPFLKPTANNQPIKKFLSLAVSWVKLDVILENKVV